MLGLKRHTVQLVEHQPAWAGLAEQACAEIRRAAAGWVADVQHVGSTSIPGLRAKPILDLALGLSDPKHIAELIPAMTQLGYIYRGDSGVSGGHLFVFEPTPEVRSIHAHAVEWGGSQWNNYLRFRDTLRRDDALRHRYERLKLDLWQNHPDDRRAYTAAKEALIREILSSERP